MQLSFRFVALALCAALLAGCSGVRLTRDMSVSQGTKLLVENFEQVKPGMSREDVRKLLGPPQIRWQLGGEVWIYYYLQRSGEPAKSAEIYFAEKGVSRIVDLSGTSEDA